MTIHRNIYIFNAFDFSINIPDTLKLMAYSSKSLIGNIELLQEYVIHIDEVHREAEEWDEQINLLAVLDHFKIRKELSNIAETLILFIEERICYFQLEDFSRVNIQSRKSLSRNLVMTQTVLQTIIKDLKSNNLLPNKLFGIRMNRCLSIAMTELISMEIPTTNPYIDLEGFSKHGKTVYRLKQIENKPISEQNYAQQTLLMFIRLKFNTCLSVYKLTLFLDMALNRSKDGLMIVPKESSHKDAETKHEKSYIDEGQTLRNIQSHSNESLNNNPSPLRNSANPELITTNAFHLNNKPLTKTNEDLAINYHLMIFTRQIENGLTLSLKTSNPILQLEIQSRLRKLRQILMEVYVDHKNIDGLMKEMKMKV